MVLWGWKDKTYSESLKAWKPDYFEARNTVSLEGTGLTTYIYWKKAGVERMAEVEWQREIWDEDYEELKRDATTGLLVCLKLVPWIKTILETKLLRYSRKLFDFYGTWRSLQCSSSLPDPRPGEAFWKCSFLIERFSFPPTKEKELPLSLVCKCFSVYSQFPPAMNGKIFGAVRICWFLRWLSRLHFIRMCHRWARDSVDC
jgi:hypothetical protein